eukprot:scaffold7218_cov613-Prasinococcus_capsulatus_cf.AAC.1
MHLVTRLRVCDVYHVSKACVPLAPGRACLGWDGTVTSLKHPPLYTALNSSDAPTVEALRSAAWPTAETRA